MITKNLIQFYYIICVINASNITYWYYKITKDELRQESLCLSHFSKYFFAQQHPKYFQYSYPNVIKKAF